MACSLEPGQQYWISRVFLLMMMTAIIDQKTNTVGSWTITRADYNKDCLYFILLLILWFLRKMTRKAKTEGNKTDHNFPMQEKLALFYRITMLSYP